MKRPKYLRVCVALAAFASLAWIADGTSGVNRVLVPLSIGTARLTEALLSSLRMSAVRDECALFDPTGFSYQIDFACTGFIPAGLLMVAILSSVAPLRAKMAGLAIGIPFTFAINFTRLVHLFYIGVHHPLAFRWAHSLLWESVMAVFLFAFYCLWIRHVYRSTRCLGNAESP